MHVCACVEDRWQPLFVLLRCQPLGFMRQGLYSSQSLLMWLGWLTVDQRSAHLCIPSTGNTGAWHHTWLFLVCFVLIDSEDEIQVFMFIWQACN